MASLDGWSLNEKLKILEAKLKRHENIIGALASKLFHLEDKVKGKSPSKKKAVKKKNVKSTS